MKTTCKLISLITALVMLLTATAIPAGAAVQNAPTGTDDCIYFDSTGWGSDCLINFYICKDGEEILPWGSRKIRGTDENNDGIWEYRPGDKGITFENGHQYFIIFYDQNNTNHETTMLEIDSSCLGDTAYVTGKSYHPSIDPERTHDEAKWKNSSCKPMLDIDAFGEVYGETSPSYYSVFNRLTDFLTRNYQWAVSRANKSNQKLLDDIGSGLGMTKNDVERAIEETDTMTEWRFEDSPLPVDSSASPNYVIGIAEGKDIKPAVPDDMIYFDANSAGWKGVKAVKFYIYLVDHEKNKQLMNAASLNGDDKNGDNIWEYALSDHGYDPDWNAEFDVVLENPATGERTLDLYFHSSEFHGTVYYTGNRTFFTKEGAYNRLVSKWKEKDRYDNDNYIGITDDYIDESGYAIDGAYGLTPEDDLLIRYLASSDGLAAMIKVTGLSAQTLIDRLGLDRRGWNHMSREDMKELLEKAAQVGTDWRSQWDYESSALPEGWGSSGGSSGSGAGYSVEKPDSDIHVSLKALDVPGQEELPNTRYKTIKGTRGEYKFYNVLPGTYKLTIKKRFNATREYIITVGDSPKLEHRQNAEIRAFGDSNGDGKLSTVDFGIANSAARGKIVLEGYDLSVSDVTGDGKVTTADAGKINSAARGKSSLWV